MNRTHGDSTAHAVRSRVLHSGVRAWSTTDFTEFPATAVTSALQRLDRNGDLVAIRHGLYWRGRKYVWGMSRPDPIELAYAVCHRRGIGWAGLSASNALGLTTQVPGTETVAVPVPKPRDTMGLRIVSRVARTARAATNLTPLEVAALEVLSDWSAVIDVTPSDAIRQLADLIEKDHISADKLARGSVNEPGPARDRLRAVLTAAGRGDLAGTVLPSLGLATRKRALAGAAA